MNALGEKKLQLDRIEDIFIRRGAQSYLGEQVTMAEHMLQCAELARNDGAQDELIVAALLHDIGHYSGEFAEDAIEQGINNFHENSGSQLLRGLFPQLVVDCIRLHVAAKRYLCKVDAGYHAQLSAASQHSLAVQGGIMKDSEKVAFETEPHFREAARLRRWDDAAKVPGKSTPSFQEYRTLIAAVASLE